MTAHDPTSQIVAQPSENSPLVTGKNKRVGVSSARLNPATRGAARREEAWRAAEEECARMSNSSSTSGVGLNFPLHLVSYNPHGPLEIFQKLLYGPRAHLIFQHSLYTRAEGASNTHQLF